MLKNEEKKESFIKVVEPVICWLNESCNPHSLIEITTISAELKSGEIIHNTKAFVGKKFINL